MEDLTFGEQVKIILGRKGMTIKHLAEMIETRTGKKMSRQNLTQRLSRDNFQEQDMRMIADILDCPFRLSIMAETSSQAQSAEDTAPGHTGEALQTEPGDAAEKRTEPGKVTEERTESEKAAEEKPEPEKAAEERTEPEKAAEERAQPGKDAGERAETEEAAAEKITQQERRTDIRPDDIRMEERDMTIGELYDIHRELTELEENAKAGESVEEIKKELEAGESRRDQKERFEPVIPSNDIEEDREAGEVNPYTGREYQSNSVRMHPSRIGYVQVYDRTIHKWTDMTEWAFLGLQERKKALLGSAYEPPIYLD